MAQFPEELLQQICSYLCFSAEGPSALENRIKLATLYSVSLANKTCNRIAHPYLYSVFNTTGRNRSLRPFLRTLVRQPKTAKIVKQIHTDPWDTEVDVEEGYAEPITPPTEVLDHFLSAVGSLNLSDALRQWLEDGLAKSLQDAELALLLCLCTNVQVMDTKAVSEIERTMVVAVLQEAISRPQELESTPLKHLRELNIAHWDTEDTTSLSNLGSFLRLPALQTFRGFMLDCNDKLSASLNSLSSMSI